MSKNSVLRLFISKFKSILSFKYLFTFPAESRAPTTIQTLDIPCENNDGQDVTKKDENDLRELVSCLNYTCVNNITLE